MTVFQTCAVPIYRLHATLSDGDRKIIRDGLAGHAAAIAEGLLDFQESGIRYDQNHTYIPAVALTAAALALKGEVAQADDWLRLSWAIMLRSRYALGEDGYYYEGTAYWSYAMHWHARWAEMMSRATGLKLMELPALRENWRYAMLMTLPGEPGAFDVGDTGLWREAKRPSRMGLTNTTMLWSVAAQLRDANTQMAANLMYKLHVERDYPAAAFLWYDPSVEAAPLTGIEPWHHFKDHDVVAWRSGWADEDTALLFRCGPPQGHAATAKLGVMKDWTMNSGHVHPDIGAFWIYARGTYLAVDTGYLAEKWTHNHNTLLVGGKGQAIDGSYWNDRGMDYKRFNGARIMTSKLQGDYGYVRGEFASVYPGDLKLKHLRRSVVMTRDWALLVDEMESDLPQTLTWLCHSDAPFEAAGEGGRYVARSEKAALAVLLLGPAAVSGGNRRTEVVVGSVPGQGKKLETNYHLRLETEANKTQRLVTLLAFLDADQQPPAARLISADAEKVTIELADAAGTPYDVTIQLATGELRGLKKR